MKTKIVSIPLLLVVFLFSGCPNPTTDTVNRSIGFLANNGTGSMDSITIASGSSCTLPPVGFVRQGYNFLHWNTSANGTGTTYADRATIDAVTNDILLYAIWGAVPSPTISFDSNHGTGSMDSVTISSGGSCTLPPVGFVRSDYDFLHWNTSADGTGTTYADRATIDNVTSDIVLYAIWESVVFRTISFHANRGTGAMTTAIVQDGDSYTIPAVDFSRTGCPFDHWNTSPEDDGTTYMDRATIDRVADDMTLYAIWDTTDLLIEINFDDGRPLEEIFDTVLDEGDPETIYLQTETAKNGSALQANLAAQHLLEARFDPVTDLWVKFDVYIESTDTLNPNTYTPLLLLCDSEHFGTGTTTPLLVGTPLYNGVDGNIEGYDSLKPVTNIFSADKSIRLADDYITHEIPVDSLLDRWIMVKLHILMEGTSHGLNIFLDGDEVLHTIGTHAYEPEEFSFNLLRLWYHDPAQSAANSNIYFDNIGLFRADPDR